jgi:putative DNA primase/helicase
MKIQKPITSQDITKNPARIRPMRHLLPPEWSEDSIAVNFSQEFGDDLLHIAVWGHWYRWNGGFWERDDKNVIRELIRQTCRWISSRCPEPHLRLRIASAATVAAVERLARTDRKHAATIEQWDSDPWLLNTPAGAVDLRIGKLRQAKREDYCTKITAVAPIGDCPLWIAFLSRITGGNIELQRYLQRVVGYLLTGVTREHAWFFFYGLGGNGKSVFINTISGLMGDYAKTAPIETFTESHSDHHPTDLAGLQGARLVAAIETEEGRRWAESKIKRLTGGDPISARFMRQDFFEYTPQLKLVVSGNHKPGLRSVDEATRRRLNLVPFTITIPAAERDQELSEKLEGEWGGILRWAIDGCLLWQKEGLNPPAIVKDATEDYLAAEDLLGGWIDECCLTGPSFSSPVAALYGNFCSWCTKNGEIACTLKRFSQSLEARAFTKARTDSVRLFKRLKLKSEPTYQYG